MTLAPSYPWPTRPDILKEDFSVNKSVFLRFRTNIATRNSPANSDTMLEKKKHLVFLAGATASLVFFSSKKVILFYNLRGMYNNGHVVAYRRNTNTQEANLFSHTTSIFTFTVHKVHKNDIIICKYGTASLEMSVSFTEGTL